MSKYTKQSRVRLLLLRITDFIVLFAPIFYYLVSAFIEMEGHTTVRTITSLSIMCVALIISLLNILLQKKLRCVLWILLLALILVIINIMPLIIMIAIGSIIDDLVLTPLIDNEKSRLIANKVIDYRE